MLETQAKWNVVPFIVCLNFIISQNINRFHEKAYSKGILEIQYPSRCV